MPPDMPAAKLRPVRPSTHTAPPVMYSQQWSPAPSITATAPELRTAKRSPARPAAYSSPPVAPYRQVIEGDRKSTRLNSSHSQISYAVFCLKQKSNNTVLEIPGFNIPASKFMSSYVSLSAD